MTYNYDVKRYDLGNDYRGIVIESTKLFNKLSSQGKLIKNNLLVLTDPDGYPVQLVKGNRNKVIRIELNVEKLENSVNYWSGVLGMEQLEKNEKHVDLAYKDDQVPLRLVEIGEKIEHETGMNLVIGFCFERLNNQLMIWFFKSKGFGRIAFSTPKSCQNELNEKILASKIYKFRHNKIELGTPGKQSVTVIILLSHPDEYEICYVNSEDYDVLCTTDPNANEELDRELKKQAKKEALK